MTFFIVLAAIVVVAPSFFWLGIRYSYRALMPVWLARMSPKEMADLAAKAAQEREDA